jgi:hypothetical protein
MAYKGPSGLAKEPEDKENYTAFPVLEHPEIKAYIHREVIQFLKTEKIGPEGDNLFYVDGVGRLRFQILESDSIETLQ